MTMIMLMMMIAITITMTYHPENKRELTEEKNVPLLQYPTNDIRAIRINL